MSYQYPWDGYYSSSGCFPKDFSSNDTTWKFSFYLLIGVVNIVVQNINAYILRFCCYVAKRSVFRQNCQHNHGSSLIKFCLSPLLNLQQNESAFEHLQCLLQRNRFFYSEVRIFERICLLIFSANILVHFTFHTIVYPLSFSWFMSSILISVSRSCRQLFGKGHHR